MVISDVFITVIGAAVAMMCLFALAVVLGRLGCYTFSSVEAAIYLDLSYSFMVASC